MVQRAAKAPELFLVAVEPQNRKTAGIPEWSFYG